MFGLDWTAIGTIIIAITLGVLVWQTRELRHSIYTSSYTAFLDMIQREEARDDRRKLLKTISGRPISQWTDDEQLTAERVCHTWDTACIMMREGMLPKEVIMKNWTDSLAKSWLAAEPLVRQRRIERQFPELWDDFEALGTEAVARRGGRSQVNIF